MRLTHQDAPGAEDRENDYLGRARELAPALEEAADEIERRR